MTPNLPPLPERFDWIRVNDDPPITVDVFTAEQMTAHALAARALALEEAAKVCDQHARDAGQELEANEYASEWKAEKYAAETCAAAIRKLLTGD